MVHSVNKEINNPKYSQLNQENCYWVETRTEANFSPKGIAARITP